MAKYSKAACNYREGDWPRECSTCVHFVENRRSRDPQPKGSCKIVVGEIHGDDLCDFWVIDATMAPEASKISRKLMDQLDDPKLSPAQRKSITDKNLKSVIKARLEDQSRRQMKLPFDEGSEVADSIDEWCPSCRNFMPPHSHRRSWN